MTDETEGVVIAQNGPEKIDHLEPVKNMIKGVGIEMPDMVATGDLTVVDKNEKESTPVKKLTKKDIPIPEVGSVFMHKGNEYKIVYINEGQHRFTCEPYKGDY